MIHLPLGSYIFFVSKAGEAVLNTKGYIAFHT